MSNLEHFNEKTSPEGQRENLHDGDLTPDKYRGELIKRLAANPYLRAAIFALIMSMAGAVVGQQKEASAQTGQTQEINATSVTEGTRMLEPGKTLTVSIPPAGKSFTFTCPTDCAPGLDSVKGLNVTHSKLGSSSFALQIKFTKQAKDPQNITIKYNNGTTSILKVVRNKPVNPQKQAPSREEVDNKINNFFDEKIKPYLPKEKQEEMSEKLSGLLKKDTDIEARLTAIDKYLEEVKKFLPEGTWENFKKEWDNLKGKVKTLEEDTKEIKKDMLNDFLELSLGKHFNSSGFSKDNFVGGVKYGRELTNSQQLALFGTAGFNIKNGVMGIKDFPDIEAESMEYQAALGLQAKTKIKIFDLIAAAINAEFVVGLNTHDGRETLDSQYKLDYGSNYTYGVKYGAELPISLNKNVEFAPFIEGETLHGQTEALGKKHLYTKGNVGGKIRVKF